MIAPRHEAREHAFARELIEEQRGANLSAVPHFDAFAEHRERLTGLVIERHVPGSNGRLCVLGAGNAYDLDLGRLAAVFREIHLVDIDEAALARAFARHDRATQSRLFLHAPVDLSGLGERVEAWRAFRVTPEQMAAYPEVASDRIVRSLPAPFELVISDCLLTQMQLSLVNGLPASHPLFEPARQLLNVMHLRTLAKLLSRGGRALVASDVSSDRLVPLSHEAPDLRVVLADALREGAFFYAAHPQLLAWTSREDPVLRRLAELSDPVDVWLWRNGPDRTYLVYASDLVRVDS